MYKVLVMFISVPLLIACTPRFVGTTVPPYPAGTFSSIGGCISDLENKNICAYSVSVVEGSNGEFISVLAGRSNKLNKSDLNTWCIVDQLSYPKIGKDHWLQFRDCFRKKLKDETIVAVVEITDTEKQQAFNWAYRLDLHSEKFVKIHAKEVTCLNPSWGV